MSAQHTPGPWVVNTAGTGDSKGRIVIDEIYVYAPDSGADDVAVAADIVNPLTGQPSEANARLIAAAPDLIASLQEARQKLAWFVESYPQDLAVPESEFFQAIDAAIAKATAPTVQRLATDDTEGGAA